MIPQTILNHITEIELRITNDIGRKFTCNRMSLDEKDVQALCSATGLRTESQFVEFVKVYFLGSIHTDKNYELNDPL